jgi:transcription factor C subunit 6
VSPSESSPKSEDAGSDGAGSDFGPEQSQSGEEESRGSDSAESGDSGSEDDASELVSEEPLEEESLGSQRGSGRPQGGKKVVAPKQTGGAGRRKKKQYPPKTLHSTGIVDTHQRSAAKDNVVLYIVGTDAEDIIALTRMRDRWINAPPLPKRKPVASVGGLAQSPFYSYGKRTNELDRDLQWYYKHGGREYFRQFQKSRETPDATEPLGDPNENVFLVGPIDDPKVCRLSCGQSTSLSEAWSKSATASKRRGWILNVGFKVQCLEWVPNRNGASQILCASPAYVPPSDPSEVRLGEGYQLAAFVAQPRKRSFFHLFEVDTTLRPAGGAPPQLKRRLTITFDWNSARRLKWCPAPIRVHVDKDRGQRLGFLAGAWLDGYVRVLDVYLPSPDTTHLHISEAAFEAKPPDTICTAVAWLSTSSLAAGCANGAVAVWNLASALGSPPTSRRPNPRPWLHKRLHRTLVANLATGYPSRPSALFTNCADGSARQTDLRSPRADRAAAPRARVHQPALAWCDGGQLAAAADDGGQAVAARFLRGFRGARTLGRAGAPALDVAASPLHGALLAAGADGSVAAVNAVRRSLFHRSDAAGRMTWFRYEWRGAVGAAPGGAAEGGILGRPLGRFVEGFKMASSVMSEEKPTSNNNPRFTVVHEENSAVNRVSWNPNLVSGTWAAAATVSGLIRIEDLALD